MADRMVQVKVRGRAIYIPNEGLTPLELKLVVAQVEKKMACLEEETKSLDTSKLAMIAAIQFATGLFRIRLAGNLK
jgi:cell division protein ZapA (FtsZ GTPase activity inhibitor)